MGLLIKRGGENPPDWNSIQNKPIILSDNQINWGEITDKPVIETGEFTPSLIDSNGFNYTHSLQSGKYYRIDNLCNFELRITIPLPSSGNGILQVNNLPYNFINDVFLNGYFHGIGTNVDPLFLGNTGTNKINIFYCTGTSALIPGTLRGSNFRTTGSFLLYCNGFYFLS